MTRWFLLYRHYPVPHIRHHLACFGQCLVVVGIISVSACQWQNPDGHGQADEKGLLQDIEIIGNRSFDSYLNWAVELLEQKAPHELQFFRQQGIECIAQVQANSGIYYGDFPTIRLTDTTTFYSITWLAGVLVHEACHLAQVRQVEAELGHSSSGTAGDFNTAVTESACIRHQLAVARLIGAPQKEISHLQSADGSHAYTAPSDQDW